MYSKLCVVKLLIAAFIIVHHDSYGLDLRQEYSKNYEKELAYAQTYKNSLCFLPTVLDCGQSLRPTPVNVVISWHYVPTTRICAPVYTPHVLNNTCAEIIKNLTRSKKECEDLCAEPCLMKHNDKLAESGICRADCHFSPPDKTHQPCPEGAKCCPRTYKLPTTTPVPVTNQNVYAQIQPYALLGIIMNIHNHPINESRDLIPMMLVNDTLKLF